MKIKKKIAIDLISCLDQINSHFKKTILVFDEDAPKCGFTIIQNHRGDFFITSNKKDKFEKTVEIEAFIETIYTFIVRGSIIVYPPVTLSNGFLVRFDGYCFTVICKDLDIKDVIRFSDFDEDLRKEYFENVV